jgi:DNA topoisomerase I
MLGQPFYFYSPGAMQTSTACLPPALSVANQRTKKETATDPLSAAKAAGLRYVTDQMPGLRRKRAGRGFTYLDAEGKTVHDPEVLQRIKALAIPPAWHDVWICPLPNGHLQATGRDAKGRKQYRYHARWRAVRDETKFDRLAAFGQALALIRQCAERDLSLPGLCRRKVLATVVRLLETTLIRVGNEEYARTNGSFGLTTLRDQHVSISGATLRFQFRGKSGVKHAIDLNDRRLAKIVQRCRDLPGQELFQYLDNEGQPQSIGSAEVNDYLRELIGEDFTAKDFRTWTGTVLAVAALRECCDFNSTTAAKRNVVRALEKVAERLGNTPAVCRKAYVHPLVIQLYLQGALTDLLEQGCKAKPSDGDRYLRPEEADLLALLSQPLKSDLAQPRLKWRKSYARSLLKQSSAVQSPAASL